MDGDSFRDLIAKQADLIEKEFDSPDLESMLVKVDIVKLAQKPDTYVVSAPATVTLTRLCLPAGHRTNLWRAA